MNEYFWILLLSVTVASCSQILLKKSAAKEHGSLWKEYLNPYVVIGYGMMAASMVLTIVAYRGLAYKNGPVVESVGYILVMFLSFFFLQEKITKKKVLGNLCILLGIAVFYL